MFSYLLHVRAWRLPVTFGLALAVLAPAAPAKAQFRKQADKEAKEQTLTPADFQRTVTVEDDAFEPDATITTINGFSFKGDFFERVRADNFLRAFVDKTTGEVRYQVYQSISYNGDWHHYEFVNYQSPAGLKTAELTKIADDIPVCQYGLCTYKEAVGFTVPEETLKSVAAQYQPGASPLWRFKYKAKSGDDWIDDMSPAEVAGLLAAVTAYKAAHGLK